MSTSAWSPLRQPLFRDRWIATIVSSTGTWMQDTAGAWLMTTLTTSPLLIALMQTAVTLPALLLGLVAGATADIIDRRRLLLICQTWMLLIALLLSFFTWTGVITPNTLLALTFLLSVGAAMSGPAWQAIVPELVSRSELPAAIALNSAGFNLARAVGPALGGLTVAAFASPQTGAGVVFLINSVSFLATITMLYRWQRQPCNQGALPAERIVGAVRSGWRYTRYSTPMRTILIRTAILTAGVSAMWALLPLVAQQNLQQGAIGYGILNGCLGVGAVLGALVLPRLRQRFSVNALITVSTLIFVAVLCILAFVYNVFVLLLTLIAAGIGWISAISSLNTAVQLSVPNWVKARALGTYQMVFLGGLAVGSAFWGAVAERVGISTALIAAATSLLAGIPVALRYRLMPVTKSELADVLALGEPHVVIEPSPQEGPVLITIEYHVDPADAAAFSEAIHQMRIVRLRDGAVRWGIFQDIASPTRHLETYVVESWAEHLRQHERFTRADHLLREQVNAFHRGHEPPLVTHMIYIHDTRLD